MVRLSFVLPLICLAPACSGGGDAQPVAATQAPPPPLPAPRIAPGGWQSLATDADRARLRGWRAAWVPALARAGASARGRVAAEGALLQPDRALPGAVPPPGQYRCRIIKLGAQSAGLPEYTAYPAFRCRIAAGEGGTLSFAKLDGSQRPIGTFYPHDGDRMIFLGTMLLGDERRAITYGRDADRDMAGAVERIGPKRWRLLLPSPRWESLFDVMELVPG